METSCSLNTPSGLTEEQAKAEAFTLITERMGIHQENISLTPGTGVVTGSRLSNDLDLTDSACMGYDIVYTRIFSGIPVPSEFVTVEIRGNDVCRVIVSWHELTPQDTLLTISDHPDDILARQADAVGRELETGEERLFRVATCEIAYMNAEIWDPDQAGVYIPVCHISGEILEREMMKAYAAVFIDISAESILHTEVMLTRGGSMSLTDVLRQRKK